MAGRLVRGAIKRPMVQPVTVKTPMVVSALTPVVATMVNAGMHPATAKMQAELAAKSIIAVKDDRINKLVKTMVKTDGMEERIARRYAINAIAENDKAVGASKADTGKVTSAIMPLVAVMTESGVHPDVAAEEAAKMAVEVDKAAMDKAVAAQIQEVRLD